MANPRNRHKQAQTQIETGAIDSSAHRAKVVAVDDWRGSELTSIALNFSFDSAVNNSMPVTGNYNRQGESRSVVGLLDQLPLTYINHRAEIETPPSFPN